MALGHNNQDFYQIQKCKLITVYVVAAVLTQKSAQCVMICVSCPDFISHARTRDVIYFRTMKIKGQAN